MLRRQQNLNLMMYKHNRLVNLKNNEEEIDEQFKKGASVQKKTLVSHSVSFTSSKRSEENLVSQEACKICDTQFSNEQTYKEHLESNQHSFTEDFSKSLKQSSKQPSLQFTINGSSAIDNIILRKEVPKQVQLDVTNTSNQQVKIISVRYNSEIEEIQFKPTHPVDVLPSKNVRYSLTASCANEGILYFPILFTTETNNETRNYSLEMVFHVHDAFFDDLHPVEPYVRTSKAVVKEYIENVDSGERPNIFPRQPMKVRLKQYLLPLDVAAVLNAGLKPFEGMTSSQEAQLVNIKNLLNVTNKQNCLRPDNYTKLLDTLLYIEEHQMYKDIRDYDREDQILVKVGGDLLELQVPGLAEHRPSVILADSVFVRESKNSKTLYEGFVHQVKESSVLLKFSRNFMNSVYLKGKKFYVNFTFNRYPLKVEHQAVEFSKADNIARLLFPTEIPTRPLQRSPDSWFNRVIANNPEQQQAVCSILSRSAMPSPYLIFGPPGTGKTMTVVESIRQIHALTSYRVLVCTPSNNAANEIARRLAGMPTTDVFRFVAPSFPFALIPEKVRQYVNYTAGAYYQPTMEQLMGYKVVLTTLINASRLVNGGCPPGHFGYVFVDESGQATETETLVPLARLLSDSSGLKGQVVLAGDPMQLGPIIHSPLAADYGFGISMLERLMVTSEPYKKDASGRYNPRALTKLLRNYRSHAAIIKKPNDLFYDGELKATGDNLINAALGWSHLPNSRFPVVFHSVVGIDQREKSSPSFFNVQEVQVVMGYLDKLLGCKMQGMAVKEEHIGVVSPYKKQVDKIKQACRNKGYSTGLMVGSVEQIQGQERLIIIISTVRSRSDFLKFDSKFRLGFLRNPKRFNVAVTRAKALLIVVGNPNVLQHDKQWRSLIRYCSANNSVVGERFELVKDEGLEEIADDFRSMSLKDDTSREDGPSFVRGVV